jgi:hypothetical protein
VRRPAADRLNTQTRGVDAPAPALWEKTGGGRFALQTVERARRVTPYAKGAAAT